MARTRVRSSLISHTWSAAPVGVDVMAPKGRRCGPYETKIRMMATRLVASISMIKCCDTSNICTVHFVATINSPRSTVMLPERALEPLPVPRARKRDTGGHTQRHSVVRKDSLHGSTNTQR